MSNRSTGITDETGNPTVYLGAYVPLRLYQLLTAEAEQAGLSRSRMVAQVLAERYGSEEQEDEVAKEHAEREEE